MTLEHLSRLLMQAADAALLSLNSANGERNGYLRDIANGHVQEYTRCRDQLKAKLEESPASRG